METISGSIEDVDDYGRLIVKVSGSDFRSFDFKEIKFLD